VRAAEARAREQRSSRGGFGVQRIAVSPLDALRPRPGRCAGKSRAVREELQCDGCGRIRTGAIEPRVVNIGGRRGEGNGRSQAALRTARGGFGGGQVRADLDPSGGGEALMAREVGRRSCGAKAAVGRDELRGVSVQPSTASSLHPCRGACVCKATDHAHAGWGLLMRGQS
jgi:hypothetical protein